ncbi:hypothetical protein JTS97_10570 [Clostridium botulinum]|nr:hypothetical protein [Clostridium botulinum]
MFTIIDSLEEGVIFVNEKCQVEVFNKYCENLFNTLKENAIRKHIKEILGQNQLILDALKWEKIMIIYKSSLIIKIERECMYLQQELLKMIRIKQ